MLKLKIFTFFGIRIIAATHLKKAATVMIMCKNKWYKQKTPGQAFYS